MTIVFVLLAIIASTFIILWYLSERAHARAETAAMRQLRNAIEYLKNRKNR